MKSVFLMIMFIAAFPVSGHGEEKDTILTVFWNLENFFDHIDDGTGESDSEFSSTGKRHWTKSRFQRKCDMIAKSIFHMKEEYGHMPDVIGFAEVENRKVLERLISYTLLRKMDYGIVHYDSEDRRGIDVAMMYRKSEFELVSSSAISPVDGDGQLRTRDILHVRLRNRKGYVTDMIVNHHPSKYGGEKKSGSRRYQVMSELRSLCDSLIIEDSSFVVAMGDFNDTPDAYAFRLMENIMVNKGVMLHDKGMGTIRYKGKWELIDMFLVEKDLDVKTAMEICMIPFLMVWDNVHAGMKPLRTYSGPRYIGGVSDHCPIILKLIL